MGDSNSSNAANKISQGSANSAQNTAGLNTNLSGQQTGFQNNANSAFTGAQGSFSNLAATGGVDPTLASNLITGSNTNPYASQGSPTTPNPQGSFLSTGSNSAASPGTSDAGSAFSAWLSQNPSEFGDPNANALFAQAEPQYAADKGLWEPGSQTYGFDNTYVGNSGGGKFNVVQRAGGGGGGNSRPWVDASTFAGPGGNSYLDVFNSIANSPTGGMDFTGTNNAISGLANQKPNYAATDQSVNALQKFASTGGVSQDEISKIDNPTLEEFAKTGGYSEADKQLMRLTGNSAIASQYGGLQDQLNRARITGSNVGPGWADTGFKLARQGAQAAGQQSVATEAGINQAVIGNRMTAASTLADKIQNLAALQSQNTLQGYGEAGQLSNQEALQIANALEQSGMLSLDEQQALTQARLSAAGGVSQDTLSRLGVQAQQSTAANQLGFNYANLNANNMTNLLKLQQGGQIAGAQGLGNLYGTSTGGTTGTSGQLAGSVEAGNTNQLGYANAQNNLAGQNPVGQNLGNIGSIASAAGGIAQGVSGLTGARNDPNAGFVPGYSTGNGPSMGDYSGGYGAAPIAGPISGLPTYGPNAGSGVGYAGMAPTGGIQLDPYGNPLDQSYSDYGSFLDNQPQTPYQNIYY